MPILKIIGSFFWILGILIFISDYLKTKRCTGETTAVIVNVTKETHRSYGSHASKRQTNYYYPTIEFSTPDKTIRVKTNIKRRRPDSFQSGGELKIRYNPQNPSDLKLQENSLWESVIGMGFMFFLGAIFFYIGKA